MNIEPFKNREVDLSCKVELYRCLNRSGYVFSLRQNGLVVGHTDNVILKGCTMHINQAGKDRCIEKQERDVHAFIRGFLGTIHNIKNKSAFPLHYNPYDDKGFFSDIVGEVTESEVVYIDNGGIFFQI